MSDRNDYSGPFDPDFRYEDLSKAALVRLVREYALVAHLLDRSGLTAVGLRYGQEAVEEIAIEEWRGASPIYGERIRKVHNWVDASCLARPTNGPFTRRPRYLVRRQT